MNILLASTNSNIASGATRCLVELAQNLKSHGINVLVTIPRHGNIEKLLKRKGIRYAYIHEFQSWYLTNKGTENHMHIKRLLNIFSFFKMRRLLKKEKIDIVHENAITAYVAAWAAQSLDIPVVWHIREFMNEDLNISFFDQKYSLNKINKATSVIAISEAVKKKWDPFIKPHIEVINDGIPIENYFIPFRKSDLKQINIILYGRIVPGKGQLFYFKGVKKLIDLNTRNIHVFWAGKIEDINYYKKINGYIIDNHLDNYVTYLGEISNIKKILKNMDIVAVCSKKEAFGRVTVEGMLAGCIVIGAKSGATGEIIQDKVTGYLYDSDNVNSFVNVLDSIISNFNKSKTIAKNGQKYAKNNFSIKVNAANIITVYQKILN